MKHRRSQSPEVILIYGGDLRKTMTPNQRLWSRTRDDLVRAVESLGFPAELGEMIARNLGSPKAMERMISYLRNVKPKTAELIVDEMLAIRSEIDAWREKKASEKANARYNEILNYGLMGADGFEETPDYGFMDADDFTDIDEW